MQWGKLVNIGMLISQLVPVFVGKVQRLKSAEPGPEKQAAVVDLVKSSLAGTELVAGKDLIDDDAVLEATRAVINAEVAVMKAKAQLEEAIASARAAAAAQGDGVGH